jgi:hypothetical protein
VIAQLAYRQRIVRGLPPQSHLELAHRAGSAAQPSAPEDCRQHRPKGCPPTGGLTLASAASPASAIAEARVIPCGPSPIIASAGRSRPKSWLCSKPGPQGPCARHSPRIRDLDRPRQLLPDPLRSETDGHRQDHGLALRPTDGISRAGQGGREQTVQRRASENRRRRRRLC